MELLQHFGGTKGVARAWSGAVREASVCRRVRGVQAMLTLMHWAEQRERVDGAERAETSHLSDDELRRELAKAKIETIAQSIRYEPKLVNELAQRFGYQLQPIDER